MKFASEFKRRKKEGGFTLKEDYSKNNRTVRILKS